MSLKKYLAGEPQDHLAHYCPFSTAAALLGYFLTIQILKQMLQ